MNSKQRLVFLGVPLHKDEPMPVSSHIKHYQVEVVRFSTPVEFRFLSPVFLHVNGFLLPSCTPLGFWIKRVLIIFLIPFSIWNDLK